MLAAANLAERDDRPQEDHFVTLRGVTWDDFERLLEMRGEHSAPRLAYLEGTVEIMSPSRSHESIKSLLGRLVEAFCLERVIDFSTYGSWTLKDKEAAAGVEPDECYIFGSARETSRPRGTAGKLTIAACARSCASLSTLTDVPPIGQRVLAMVE